ncbi:hypothetical protein QM012_000751 [Aureobasidium pullulans]|uniref:Zn(2)-C6 fungal-type domain-containing protein n=1 Tax=Aureobasidium pullulans TaxID=5580 RepID=A0ABR0TWF8_AURPU
MEADTGRSITRTRPSLTCLPCKRRKVKCDKKRPHCEQCAKFNDQCVYGDPLPQNASGNRPQKRQRTESTNLELRTTSPSHHVVAAQQAPQTPPDTVDSQSDAHGTICVLPSTYSTNDGDLSMFQDCMDMYMPSPNTLLNTSIFSNSSIAPRVDPLPIEPNHTAILPQHDWTTQFDPILTQVEKPSAIDRWVSKTVATAGHVYPALQVARHKSSTLQAESLAELPDSSCQPPPLRHRVHSPFWAFASNRDSDCDLLLRAQQSRKRSRTVDSRRWDDACKPLLSLPPKKICDVLLQSFLLSVRPLLPLCHGPTLQADYDSFWAALNRYRASKKPEEVEKFYDFLCLLWAVLFCGAVAASPAMFKEASIQIRDSRTLLSRLRAKLDETVQLVQFNEIPTLNGLISILLVEECDPDFDEITAAAPFAYKCMQAARTLNLHKEAVVAAKNGVESELARRVWYHVVQLEVLATITCGVSLSYYSSEASFDTRMPRDIHDSELRAEKGSPKHFTAGVACSSAMQLAIGRFQLNRALRQAVEKCYSTRPPSETDLEELLADIGRYEQLMDHTISRLEVRGLPEQGHVSTKLLRADPMIHKRLYRDDPNEETVFNAFARIMLSMMKGYVSILVTRHFLSTATGDQRAKLWTSALSICTQFLRNYLHLAQLPAFSPYHWFCPGKIQPLQECMIVLTYLKECPQDDSNQMLSYLLDEVFDLFGTSDATSEGPLWPEPKQRYKAAWEVLQSLREEITSRKDSPLDGNGVSPLGHTDVNAGLSQSDAQSANGQLHESATLHGQSLSQAEGVNESWLDILDYTVS